MRRIWLGLQCDDDNCGTLFPMSQGATAVQPVDGAIYTWTMLRAEAAQLGWQRFGGKDYCPKCEKKHRNQAARAKGGN
jgi:hypothetical protein